MHKTRENIFVEKYFHNKMKKKEKKEIKQKHDIDKIQHHS